MKKYIYSIALLSVLGCSTPKENKPTVDEELYGIEGKEKYLHMPFSTAGNKLYVIQNQDGNFPNMGYHVQDEMGGIWMPPVKIMDGYQIILRENGKAITLNHADQFVNYPYGSKMIYHLDQEGIDVEVFQYVPDDTKGLSVDINIINKKKESRGIEVSFVSMIDLVPVWLSERLNIEDGKDQVNLTSQAIEAKDANNDWYVVISSDKASSTKQSDDKYINHDKRTDKNVNPALVLNAEMKGEQSVSLPVYIGGSDQSLANAKAVIEKLKKEDTALLSQKKERLLDVKNTTRIDIPNKRVEEMYDWTKYNIDWLIKDVDGMGRGIFAGLPEYPWFFGCDNTYALQGILATGRPDLVKDALEMLFEISQKENKGNGRIIHEVSTNGVVYNPGNIQETPHYIMMVLDYYKWTGDKAFVEKVYPYLVKGLDWLKTKDVDGNLFPDGPGIMEIHGLHGELIDVAVYTQQAYASMAEMATDLGKKADATKFQKAADELKHEIQTTWWVEESNSFADFVATPKEAETLIDEAIVRVSKLKRDWAVEELQAAKKRLKTLPQDKKQGFVVYHNWVTNTPLEVGLATEEQAMKMLEQTKRFTNHFGVYVTGIDSDLNTEKATSFADEKSGEDFNYTGSVMTIPTGVQAMAAAEYNQVDQMLDYLTRLSNAFSYALPGSMFEVSPDYGCFAQEWNIYGTALPIVKRVFGVDPDVPHKTINIHPNVPEGWNDFKLTNLPVGTNNIEKIAVHKENNTITFTVNVKEADGWVIDFALPTLTAKSITVNGKEVKGKVTLTEKNNTIVVSE